MRRHIAMGRPAALLLAALWAAPAGAASPPSGSVTFLSGVATRQAGGKTEKLATGSLVHQDDLVETGARTRLELKLPDKSVIRLGPRSKLRLAAAVFGENAADRTVSASLLVGQIWAKVEKAVGGQSRFEVQTRNAVAGVRGTTFRVDARQDRSCVVKVYSGAVAVAGGPVPRKGHAAAADERRQVPGPQPVSREQWERLVGKMMQVAVSADGSPGEPEAFALAAPDADPWEAWNRERDGEG
ncbi:MAG TPA: FecR family protein [Anaeromyxobacteraceae bacterium]|nr:FecR family protein [Anaeromyxobacteraceae bacterium]